MKARSYPATQYLIAAICLVYIANFYIFPHLYPFIQEYLFLIRKFPYFNGDTNLHGVYAGEWWRVITVVFTHANLLHIGSNMLALWSVGSQFEIIAGKTKFLILFFGSAAIASLVSLQFLADEQPSVGASGAIFGLFGGLLVYAKLSGYSINYNSLIGTIVLNLLITFTNSQIDWHAHLGGLVGGAVIAYLLAKSKKRPKQDPWKTSWDSDLN